MTLIQLANFIRIAELQSLSKAAAVIRIAQPALSRQVRDMEAEFGASLLIRHPWGVSLTAAGEILLDRARSIVAEADAARDAVRAVSGEPAGQVSLGVPTSLAAAILPELAMNLNRKFPKIQARLVEGFSDVLHRQMISGYLDIAVLYQDRALGPLVTSPLLREPIVLVAPVKAKLFKSSSTDEAGVALPDILIVPARPNRLRDIVDGLRADRNMPQMLMEVDSLSAIVSMVKRGLGFTFLPYSSVVDEVTRGEVAVHTFRRSGVSRTLYLTRSANRHPLAAFAAVESEVRDIVERHARTMRWEALPPS